MKALDLISRQHKGPVEVLLRCEQTGEELTIQEWAKAISAKTGSGLRSISHCLSARTKRGPGVYLGLTFVRVQP